jgi:K+ transporter
LLEQLKEMEAQNFALEEKVQTLLDINEGLEKG